MNLFELFGKVTHPETRRGWVETTAHFTGEANDQGYVDENQVHEEEAVDI